MENKNGTNISFFELVIRHFQAGLVSTYFSHLWPFIFETSISSLVADIIFSNEFFLAIQMLIFNKI